MPPGAGSARRAKSPTPLESPTPARFFQAFAGGSHTPARFLQTVHPRHPCLHFEHPSCTPGGSAAASSVGPASSPTSIGNRHCSSASAAAACRPLRARRRRRALVAAPLSRFHVRVMTSRWSPSAPLSLRSHTTPISEMRGTNQRTSRLRKMRMRRRRALPPPAFAVTPRSRPKEESTPRTDFNLLAMPTPPPRGVVAAETAGLVAGAQPAAGGRQSDDEDTKVRI